MVLDSTVLSHTVWDMLVKLLALTTPWIALLTSPGTVLPVPGSHLAQDRHLFSAANIW